MAMAEALRQPVPASEPCLIGVFGVVVEAFPEGALWWDHERLLVVADLHLEKGSFFARRGQFLPPYDTAETLERLATLVRRLDPRVVVALGDSFHDNAGAERLSARDGSALAAMQAGREWVWIAGNHDPQPPTGLAGACVETFAVGPLTFRHQPASAAADGEVAGHLHPCARVIGLGRSVRRPCFIGDGLRLILPAFGAYTGGLDVLDPAFGELFSASTFRAYVLGEDRVYPVAQRALRAG